MSISKDPNTVSVIVPAYNTERFVAEAIESALGQSVAPLEVIVIDDGSTDRTADVLQKFGPAIAIVTQSNRGLPAARNAGAAMASGYWLAFLDADDLWLPHKLERQLQKAADPRLAMIYTDRFNIGERGILPIVQSAIQPLYSGDIFIPLLMLGNHITASSVTVRNEVFRALGGFAEDLRAAEDWDLWIRLAEHHLVGACTDPLVRYRFHGSMMSGDPRRMQIARREVVRRALQSPRGRSLDGSTRRRIVAATARTNGWDAARQRAWRLAAREYAHALLAWPFEAQVYRDLLRILAGAGRV